MPDEPLFVLIERMRRALQDAARVRAKVESRLRELSLPETPTAEPPSTTATVGEPLPPVAPEAGEPLPSVAPPAVEPPATVEGTPGDPPPPGKGEPGTGGAA